MGGSERAARHALAAWLGEEAEVPDLSPLGDGHINDTWLVERSDRRLVLQRLNGEVFPDPTAIAEKVAAVSRHVAGRVPVARLLAAADGRAWHEDGAGVWRLAEFVPGSRTLQTLGSDAQAEAAGRAFGSFQRALVGLPMPVAEPIPGFLQLQHYREELEQAIGPTGGAGGAEDEARIAAAVQLIERYRFLDGVLGEPDRLIHGDCKVNNLLFDEGGDEVVGIIDLDTVMWGHWAWDFGDLVRSASAGVGLSLPRFVAAARGFVNAAELSGAADALVLAPRYLALMLGVRFLTDHLRGDRYFKVSRHGDNLDRAWAQLRLLEQLEQGETRMRAAVAGL